MNITSLFIGSELLVGQTANSNLFKLGEILSSNGYQLTRSETIPDDITMMLNSFRRNFEETDVLIVVGGLGPTSDDITRKAMAQALNLNTYTEEKVMTWLREKLANRPTQPKEEYLTQQAESIEGAEIIWNLTGLAPALRIQVDKSPIIYLLPGPPREFTPLVSGPLLDDLQKNFPADLLCRKMRLLGTKESYVENTLKPHLEAYPNVLPAYCANLGSVALRLDTHPKHSEELNKLWALAEQLFEEEKIETNTIEEEVIQLLKEKQLTVATAESCTGGLIGGALSGIAGSSEVFLGSVNTYANEWKNHLLQVPQEILDTVGAVSEDCARAMVTNLCELYKTDCGIAVSGIAGPGGGTNEKPVGLVYIATYIKGQIKCVTQNFRGNRKDVREQTVTYALNQLRLQLLGK